MSETPRILFVGLGSPHGDDQIGWLIAEALHLQVSERPDISVRKAAVPLDLLDWLEGINELHICDACCSDEKVGSLSRLQVSTRDGIPVFHELEWLRCSGSHDFDPGAVLDLAGRLGRLPEHVVVHAVSGCSFDPGEAVTEELAVRVPAIIRTILKELTDARDVTGAVAAKSG